MPVSVEGAAAARIIRERREQIAGRVTGLYFEARPNLEATWKGARKKCTEDTGHHLDYLCEALVYGRSSLFVDYAVWVATVLANLDIPGEALALNLELLQTTLAPELEGAGGALAAEFLSAARTKLQTPPPQLRCQIEGTGEIDVLARNYLAALLRGERHAASQLIMAAADGGISIADIYLLVFQRTQREVGRLWQSNQIGVGQEHYCTACTQMIMSQLYPRIFSSQRTGRRLLATCVGGDLHEIGLRMVTDFFEMKGWDTYFLGANTPISGTLQQLATREPHVLAISATISIHLQAVADLIAAARAAGSPARILVGGTAFMSTFGLWQDVGADGYARDATEAISAAEGWAA